MPESSRVLITLAPAQHAEFRVRADRDFVNRSVSGIVLYAVFWPLFCLLTGFHHIHPTFSLWLGVALISVSLLRYLHLSVGWKLLYQTRYNLWNSLLYLLCFGHAVTWTILFASMITIPSFEITTLPLLCTFAGIISAANLTLIPKFWLGQIYLSIIFIPTLIACQFNPAYDTAWPIILTFWIYQILTAKRFSKEYVNSYTTEAKLQEKQQELELASKTDSLTRLYNRRCFDHCFDIQWDLAVRQQSSLAILIIDIDRFKHINDEYGHITGDECLVHVAQLIKTVAKRATDMVFRYGGEEFIAILPQTNSKNACQMAEAIRAGVESNTFVYADHAINITVSIGVHAIRPDAKTDKELLVKHADKALFLAKDKGRNRVELAQPD